MSRYNLFATPSKKEYFNTLHEKLHAKFPDDNEEFLLEAASVAGLLASIAYIDFHIHEEEREFMNRSLIHWMEYPPEKAQIIAEVAISDIVELSGVENYTYTEALSELLDKEGRYALLETLFELAASDGGVTEKEGEEIRIICKGLKLEHRHFIAARASVLDYLNSLSPKN